MDLQANVLRQLKNRREGFSLEQPFYIDQDYFKLDMEMIWYRDWLFIGHDCEIPRAGNYFTVQIGDYPVVIVRGKDQAIRAFHNTCRHRGHRVCTQDKGASAKLVCPYHQWTYDLDGSLVFARQMGENFAYAKEFGLKTVHATNGVHYVEQGQLARRTTALDRSEIEPYLKPHRLSEAKIAVREHDRREGQHGSSSGKTTASATIAPETIRSFAVPIRKPRPQPAYRGPAMTRSFPSIGHAVRPPVCRPSSRWIRRASSAPPACR